MYRLTNSSSKISAKLIELPLIFFVDMPGEIFVWGVIR